jgi:hypothetical protein
MRGVILILFLTELSFGAQIADLLSNTKEFDRKRVEVKGEVIGFPVKVRDGWFINILDRKTLFGIFVKQMPEIEYWGSYKAKGDTVVVSGVFHRACKVHNGEPDIHADSIMVIRRGEKREEMVENRKIVALILLSLLALTAVIIYRLKFY